MVFSEFIFSFLVFVLTEIYSGINNIVYGNINNCVKIFVNEKED